MREEGDGLPVGLEEEMGKKEESADKNENLKKREKKRGLIEKGFDCPPKLGIWGTVSPKKGVKSWDGWSGLCRKIAETLEGLVM